VDKESILYALDELDVCVTRLATRLKHDSSWISPKRMSPVEIHEEYLYATNTLNGLKDFIRDLELKALKDG
jgi:hypothetical protein